MKVQKSQENNDIGAIEKVFNDSEFLSPEKVFKTGLPVCRSQVCMYKPTIEVEQQDKDISFWKGGNDQVIHLSDVGRSIN